MDENNYLGHEALAMLVAAQGRTVEKILCHLWVNRINKDAPVELIDNLELHFTDKQKLTISCNEAGDALDVIRFDFNQAATALNAEFEGKIRMFAVDASSTKMWEQVPGKKLTAVKVMKEEEFHKSESILLEFDDERRIVSISPLDGLIIDYYED